MKTAAVLSAIMALANAHATFQQLWRNGEDLESTCARLPTSNSPIEDYSSNALQCNISPSKASGKCSFKAGDSITLEMHAHDSRSCTEEAIGGAHWGPVLAYMSKVEDAAAADGSSEFFKVYQNAWKKNPAANQGDNDFWGTKDLNYNCGKLDFTIPSDIAPGDYLLRAEAIALHAAGPSGGAQHYVTCYQLTVTGSGTLVPKGVKFPDAYSKTGPGLGFSIHADLSDYPVPGPALIAGGTEATPQLLTFGKISGAAPVVSAPAVSSTKAVEAAVSSMQPTSSKALVSSTPAVVSSEAYVQSTVESKPTSFVSTPKPFSTDAPYLNTTAKATPSSTPVMSLTPSLTPVVPSVIYSVAPKPVIPTTFATVVRPQPTQGTSGTVKEYAQCGGLNHKGATVCAEGLECKAWNPYYSQCIEPEANNPAPVQGMPSKAPAATYAAPAPVTPEPTYAAPAPVATYPTEAEPTVVDPAGSEPVPTGTAPSTSEPADKLYTLETFIAYLQEKAGSESADKIRRMIEALQM